MVALTGARLRYFITQTLHIPLKTVHAFWSDSQIVLYWIKSDRKLHQFVSHRVTEIHQLTSTAKWKYCPTEENPVDLHTNQRHHSNVNKDILALASMVNRLQQLACLATSSNASFASSSSYDFRVCSNHILETL